MNSGIIFIHLFLSFFSLTLANPAFRIKCLCPRLIESYSVAGAVSIDLYATFGPVTKVDYGSCDDVKVICTTSDPNWESDAWAGFNGTMTSPLAGVRIRCDEESATWHVEGKNGEKTTWMGVSVWCQDYRAR